MVHKKEEDNNNSDDDGCCVISVSPPRSDDFGNNAQEMKELLPPQRSNRTVQNVTATPLVQHNHKHQRRSRSQTDDQETQNDDDDDVKASVTRQHANNDCPRTGRYQDWIPLTSFSLQDIDGGSQINDPALPPFAFWMRPLCCHEQQGCDFKELCFVDKVCFPEDPQEVTEYCCSKMAFSYRSFGVAVIKDNRSIQSKWKTTMTNPHKHDNNSSSSAFSSLKNVFSVFSMCSSSESKKQEAESAQQRAKRESIEATYFPAKIPTPPSPEHSQIIAYAIVKVQSSERCRAFLTNPMCSVREEHLPSAKVCLDLQSVAVTPAFRRRGIAELVIKKSLESAWNAAHSLLRKFKSGDRKILEKFFENEKEEEDPLPDDEEEAEKLDEDGAPKQKQQQQKKLSPRKFIDPFADDDSAKMNADSLPPMNPFALHATLCVRRGNERAIRVYKNKFGFVYEESRYQDDRQQRYHDGTLMDRMGTWVDFSKQ